MLRIGRLDESSFFSDLVELSQGFIVIEKLDVGHGKIHLVEYLFQLAAFESGGSNDGYPEDMGSSSNAVHAKSTRDSGSKVGAAGGWRFTA